jgi:hypothetical protein
VWQHFRVVEVSATGDFLAFMGRAVVDVRQTLGARRRNAG